MRSLPARPDPTAMEPKGEDESLGRFFLEKACCFRLQQNQGPVRYLVHTNCPQATWCVTSQTCANGCGIASSAARNNQNRPRGSLRPPYSQPFTTAMLRASLQTSKSQSPNRWPRSKKGREPRNLRKAETLAGGGADAAGGVEVGVAAEFEASRRQATALHQPRREQIRRNRAFLWRLDSPSRATGLPWTWLRPALQRRLHREERWFWPLACPDPERVRGSNGTALVPFPVISCACFSLMMPVSSVSKT